jgi:exosortase
LKGDIGWSVLLGIVFAASPLSGAVGSHPRVSVVAGIVVGMAVFAVRRLRSGRRPDPQVAAPPLFRPTEAPPLVWVLLGVTAIAFLPTIIWLFGQFTESIWRNAHGVFVPIVMVVLARTRLRRNESQAEESSSWGIPLLLIGVLLTAIDSGVRSGLLSTVGLVIALPGLSLVLLGSRRTRAIAFPLALGVFLMPIPEKFPEPLHLDTATSALVEPLLQALGVPTLRHQTAFVLPVGAFGVSTNCSGIPTLYAGIFLALILAAHARRWPRRIALLLTPWPITVCVNSIRTAFLIALCNRYGLEVLDTPIHGLTGVGTLWAVVFLILAFDGRLRFWKMPP